VSLKDLLPREHGTWAMLLIPWVVGCGVARRLGAKELLLLIAAVALFLAHHQLLAGLRLRWAAAPDRAAAARVRRRVLALAAAGALALLPLLAGWGLLGLLALGAVAIVPAAGSVFLVRARLDHAVPGQVLAAAALALSAPAAHYVARGAWTRAAVALWAVNFLFFLGAVAYVQLKIDALRARAPFTAPAGRLAFAARTLALDAAVVVAAWGALRLGGLSPAALAAFGPVAVQALVGVARLHRPARLKRLGLLAVAHSVVFALLVIALA
jgi:hypothetical protein